MAKLKLLKPEYCEMCADWGNVQVNGKHVRCIKAGHFVRQATGEERENAKKPKLKGGLER